MGKLQSPQDIAPQPCGHDVAPLDASRVSPVKRAVLWVGVMVQLLAFGVLAGDERNGLPNGAAELVVRYTWIASLLAIVVVVATWLPLRNNGRSLDVIGFAGSVTLNVAGGLYWVVLAWAFAHIGA